MPATRWDDPATYLRIRDLREYALASQWVFLCRRVLGENVRRGRASSRIFLHGVLFAPFINSLQHEIDTLWSETYTCMGAPWPPMHPQRLDRIRRAAERLYHAPECLPPLPDRIQNSWEPVF